MKEQELPKIVQYFVMIWVIALFVGLSVFCFLFAENSYRYVRSFQKEAVNINAEILMLDVAEKCTVDRDRRKTCTAEPRLMFQFKHPELGLKKYRRFISRNLTARLRQNGLENGVPIAFVTVHPSDYNSYFIDFGDFVGLDLKESKLRVRIVGEEQDWLFYLIIIGAVLIGLGCGFFGLLALYYTFKSMSGSRRV